MNNRKTYPPSWVVIQNNIQECFKSMSIDEKRLLVLASPIARTSDATEKDAIKITAESFAKECNIKTHSAYKSMEEASKSLLRRYFTYTDEKGKRISCSWVIRAKYDSGEISICFPEEVLLMLKEFDKLNPYTKYKKDVVLRLRKDYSFDIYHLAKKHQAMGQFEMSLGHMKDELGLPPSYDKLCNLKDRVLKPSINEITANTDIELTYENVKKGRSVVGFKFFVKEKPKLALEEPKQKKASNTIFCKMSDAQINKYSMTLSKLSELSDLSTFPDYSTFAFWIAGILRDHDSVRAETAKRVFKALHQKTDFKPLSNL